MNKDFERFMQSYETKSISTYKVIKSFSAIAEFDYSDCTVEDIEKYILDMKPNSEKVISTICSIMGSYAKFIHNDRFYYAVQYVDKKALWVKAKPNAIKKFISNKTFEEVYKSINLYEDYNPLYYQTLFRCLYEGVYTDSMDVIKNLRASDIHGNIVTLHEDDGRSYDLEVSELLAANLIELSTINTWKRNNRYGVMEIGIEGLHYDSCFKFEVRKEGTPYSSFSYYRKLRKIAKEYVGFDLRPFHLYISGIVYRIALKLKEHNIDLNNAFIAYERNELVRQIMMDELKRCNCNTNLGNFKMMIRGRLDEFTLE